MSTTTKERLMPVPEFAARIGVKPRTAYRIIAAGQVDWTDVSTGRRPEIRISESALGRYLKARERKGRKAA